MRERIKSLALELFIEHGYHGVSFGDLASALKTSRPNIHYHFGNKQKLVEEILMDYIDDTIATMDAIWNDPDTSLVSKIEENVAFSRTRYLKHNPSGKEGRPWSLIARVRQDANVLTPQSLDALHGFAAHLYECISNAVTHAVERNKEFIPTMPVDDVALQLFNIANSASPITQDSGNFDRLAQLYMGFARVITRAFGIEPQTARPGHEPTE